MENKESTLDADILAITEQSARIPGWSEVQVDERVLSLQVGSKLLKRIIINEKVSRIRMKSPLSSEEDILQRKALESRDVWKTLEEQAKSFVRNLFINDQNQKESAQLAYIRPRHIHGNELVVILKQISDCSYIGIWNRSAYCLWPAAEVPSIPFRLMTSRDFSASKFIITFLTSV